MPKKGARQMREQGLEKTDNDFEFTSWPQPVPINQKNYYTEYLKRDDQILVLRLQNEQSRDRMTKAARDKDRALANGQSAAPDPDAMDVDDAAGDDGTQADSEGSGIIIIHPGSQNLRIGLSSEVLPKTVPMVIARRSDKNETEASDVEVPRREHDEDGSITEDTPHVFGEDFYNTFTAMSADIKQRMRRKGRRIVPNCKEVAIAFNKKTSPTSINEHNDFSRIDWTEPTSPEQRDPAKAPDYYTGHAALRIPHDSKPRYQLRWPLRYGAFNEADYTDQGELFRDFTTIIEEAIKKQVGLQHPREWPNYGIVFVIPDLYDRNYVNFALDLFIRELGFERICFIQESLAGSFGAGYPSCVIVDVGAQKTSVCCVDEGLCLENSRINLRMGGADVTSTFLKMLMVDYFPYTEINLQRRHDFVLAEELKTRFCTLSVQDFTAQQYDFFLRVFNATTLNYVFKAYDEVILAPMALFRPDILGPCLDKAKRRGKLIARSTDLYDGSPNDPISQAQTDIMASSPALEPQVPAAVNGTTNGTDAVRASAAPPTPAAAQDTPAKRLSLAPGAASTPMPEDGTPGPRAGTPSGGLDGGASGAQSSFVPGLDDAVAQAEARERTVPLAPLHAAILASIEQGARGDDKKMRDFLGGILPIGGGSLVPSFKQFLEDELVDARGALGGKDIMVAAPPREIDPQVLVWKGASVFGKLKSNDSWISRFEYERLGTRTLAYKCAWNF